MLVFVLMAMLVCVVLRLVLVSVHVRHHTDAMRIWHHVLPMTQEDPGIEDVARSRLRSLRLARGWSLDDLAKRSFVSASTISRIETGHRRLAIDTLAALTKALGATVDDILGDVEDDIVIRPAPQRLGHGVISWPLTGQHDASGRVVAKMRFPASTKRPEARVHPGRDWCYVLSGTARLFLGDAEHRLETGQAAEFSTMTPHWIAGYRQPVELLVIFDRHGEQAHLTPR